MPDPTTVTRLGPSRHLSPLPDRGFRCVDPSARVLLYAETDRIADDLAAGRMPPSFEIAGPRRELFFDPTRTSAGIVTCGGLCPGLNDVIRGLTLTLWHHYGVRRILGYRYGFAGISGRRPYPAMPLDPDAVANIHETGGTILGSSRGPQDLDDMVETLQRDRVDLLFVIGGDGSLRGAHALAGRLAERSVPIAVVGIPKTIDNDIEWVIRSFGFSTAVEAAGDAIDGAHVEARGALNGIGIVKLMGRHAGFIAAHATLSNSDVNFCLVPEFPCALDGPRGLFQALRTRLERRQHAVIAVAEGFGQDLLAAEDQRDASGNRKLGDIGVYLRDRIAAHFRACDMPVTIKYIDPSYLIRGIPANALDSELCVVLAQHAVHAAMAGCTDTMIGWWHQRFTQVPIPMAIAAPRQITPDSPAWQRVLETTGQGELLDFVSNESEPTPTTP
jgi:6-phosphofructokinase 1